MSQTVSENPKGSVFWYVQGLAEEICLLFLFLRKLAEGQAVNCNDFIWLMSANLMPDFVKEICLLPFWGVRVVVDNPVSMRRWHGKIDR